MESIKEIFVPESNKIVLTIPDKFIGKKIEVFATEMEDTAVNRGNKSNRSFTVLNTKVEGYKFNREEANER